MKVYTRTGDRGTTSLVGGTRSPKACPRLDAYGTIDELNAWIGILLSNPLPDPVLEKQLRAISNKLFDAGGALATEPDSGWTPPVPTPRDIQNLEQAIDTYESQLPSHDRFILPGGTPQAANANMARTVARRAERLICAMPPDSCPAQDIIQAWVNRLSDYLFVVSRYLNFLARKTENFWEKDCPFQ